MQQKITNLEKTIEKMSLDKTKQLSGADNKIEKLAGENGDLRLEVQKLKVGLSNANDTNTTLRNQLNNQEKTEKTLQARIKQLSEENTALQQKLKNSSSKFESTISYLKSQLREKDEVSSNKIKNLEDSQQKSQNLWDQEKSELLKKIFNLEKMMKEERGKDTQVQKLERKSLPTKFR